MTIDLRVAAITVEGKTVATGAPGIAGLVEDAENDPQQDDVEDRVEDGVHDEH